MPLPIGLRRRRAATLAASAAWATTAITGTVMLTQALGWDGTPIVAAGQALTPYLVLACAGSAVIARACARHTAAVGAAVVGMVGLGLAAPLVFTPSLPPTDDDSAQRLASVNLLYTNNRTVDIANTLSGLDLDAIVFNEYNDAHRATLLNSPLADQLPYRVERRGEYARGIAIWSARPLATATPPPTPKASVAAVLDNGVELIAFHPPTPVGDNAAWRANLAALATAIEDPQRPTVVLGDFNATYWNPSFRQLLRQGYRDAAAALGRGFAATWPTDRLIPAFAGIDHALVERDRLVPTAFDTFEVPGSDHRGIVVTVSRRR
ncbi:MAG: endonuclease/exonuclease/phosphatase family protein [Actinomycetota bacterium]